jgi:hypothetical protein
MRGEAKIPDRIPKDGCQFINIAVVVLLVSILACVPTIPGSTPSTGELIIIEGVNPRGISANGEWVVGEIYPEAFKWSEQTGVEVLSGMDVANAVSDDGRVVVGNRRCTRSGAIYDYMDNRLKWYEDHTYFGAMLWIEGLNYVTPSGEFSCLAFDYELFGFLNGESRALDVSPDGRFVVGESIRYVLDAFCHSIMTNPDYQCVSPPTVFERQAVVWHLDISDSVPPIGEIRETILPGLSDHHFSGMAIAAGNTATVVGWDSPPPWSSGFPSKEQQPFRAVGDCSAIPCSWQTASLLGSPPEESWYAQAVNISQDQSTIVGHYFHEVPTSAAEGRAFKWTADNGLEILSGIDGGYSVLSKAWAVSVDGRVIVGQAWSESENRVIAAVWTPLFGAESLRQLLIDRYNMGEVLEQCVLETAVDISDDARTILAYGHCVVGGGLEEGALVIRLSKPPNHGYVPQGD